MIPNSPAGAHDPTVSSQLGRKWLESSASRPTANETPSDDLTTDQTSNEDASMTCNQPQNDTGNRISVGQPPREPVLIAIPDVSAGVGDAFSMLDNSLMKESSELAIALSRACDERLAAVGEVGLSELSVASPAMFLNTPATTPNNDLAEPPTEWTDKPPTKDLPRKDVDKPSKQSTTDQAIEKLANSIIERFPIGDPTVLMFVGSESNKHIDQTCARVAATLADRKIGRILLLDSDIEEHALSDASGVSGQPGITDVVNDSVPWDSAIYGRSATGLDFLASGTSAFHHRDSSNRLRQAVAEMKREYQFICISAGDARSASARIWNDICDGSYLLVSMKNSNKSIAKSAVTEMQSSGARLLGCVVTDVN